MAFTALNILPLVAVLSVLGNKLDKTAALVSAIFSGACLALLSLFIQSGAPFHQFNHTAGGGSPFSLVSKFWPEMAFCRFRGPLAGCLHHSGEQSVWIDWTDSIMAARLGVADRPYFNSGDASPHQLRFHQVDPGAVSPL